MPAGITAIEYFNSPFSISRQTPPTLWWPPIQKQKIILAGITPVLRTRQRTKRNIRQQKFKWILDEIEYDPDLKQLRVAFLIKVVNANYTEEHISYKD